MTTTTTTTAPAKKAPAAKAKPEPATAPTPLTRTQAVARVRELGYEGPVSYSMPVLRGIVAWVEAGKPKDGAVPTGVLHSVYPQPKVERGNPEARAVAADLRAAITQVMRVDDPREALDLLDGLAARLRELLVTT